MNKTSKEEQDSDKIKNPPKKVAKLLTQQDAVDRNIQYIKDRANGNIEFLKTDYYRLNNALNIEWNTMLTISALSGGGKSTLSKRISNSILSNLLLKSSSPICISFNFEMLAHKTIGREIAHLSKIQLSDLYSSKEKKLTEKEIDYIVSTYHEHLKSVPIYYVEEPEDYDTISNTIYYYWKKLCKPKNKGMIVEVDHAAICRGKQGDGQKEKIDKLMENLNFVKKKIANERGKVFFIVLSQMNRSIKSTERITNSVGHYPMTSDLFAASTIEYFSDYILISHSPSKLHLASYTPERLPIYADEEKKNPWVYWHILKDRDGSSVDTYIPLIANFKYFDFVEVPKKTFIEMHKQFKNTGKCSLSDELIKKLK